MIEKTFIQVDDDGVFIAPCGFSLWEGTRFLGYNPTRLKLFNGNISEDDLSKSTVVHGWVKTVHDALKLLNVKIPNPIDYPPELSDFLGRKVEKTSLDFIHNQVIEEEKCCKITPKFIKPVQQKLFTGHTVEKFSHLSETSCFLPQTEVWKSDVIDIKSEWRCFVHEYGLRDIRRYSGDAWSVPNKNTIISMIKEFKSSPVAYALDVCVTSDNRTLLVEANDCYSLGDYGISQITYAEMVIDRWIEMVK